jgi:hypothetical protein
MKDHLGTSILSPFVNLIFMAPDGAAALAATNGVARSVKTITLSRKW